MTEVADQHCAVTGKRSYRSKRHAREAIKRLHATLRIYVCGFCRLWHLTSDRSRRAP